MISEVEPKLVTDTEKCKDITSLLSQEKILAVDCQGVYRGSHLRLTLLQIGTSRGDVYLFDVQENRDLLSGGPLRNLLESENIEKVMFKCSKDSGALYHGFQITLRNVFDIQDAHIILEEEKKGRKLFPALMLRDVCQVYSSTDKVSKDEEEIMKICAEESCRFWEERPFTDKMMSVAVGNVRALIPEVYGKQKRLIEECGLTIKFKERVFESVQLNIDTTFKKRRIDRIHERAMEILRSTDRTCTAKSTLMDFAEDSEEMLALRIVDFGDVQNMSKKIQQLKKEHINIYLDKICGEVKSDKSETLVTLGKLRFLKKNKYHPDTSIAEKARDIRKEIQNIILASIEEKYDENTEISFLSETEQEILRPLNIGTKADTDFSPLINILFWRLLEKDMAKKSETLHRYRRNFKLNKYFYERMKTFASSPSSAAVPNHVRANAKKFLDDIRLYKVNTNF